MLRSARPALLSPHAVPHRVKNSDLRTHFTSLSNQKKRKIFMSEVNRGEPISQKPLLHSEYKGNSKNKQNVREEYRLFTNAIKEKVKIDRNRFIDQNPYSTPASEYWNFQGKKCSVPKQTPFRTRERVNSKQKVEKLFEQAAPNRLIKNKSNKEKQRMTVKVEDSVVLLAPRCSESRNEGDFVNTSQRSVQFDMSPHLY